MPRPVLSSLLGERNVLRLVDMRSILVLVMVLGACGGGDELHDVTTCSNWGQVSQCEFACSEKSGIGQLGSDSCAASDPVTGDSTQCDQTAAVGDAVGCCRPIGAGSETVVRFYECE
jgi:hypothetical protein